MRRHRRRSQEQLFPLYSWHWHFVAKIGFLSNFGDAIRMATGTRALVQFNGNVFGF